VKNNLMFWLLLYVAPMEGLVAGVARQHLGERGPFGVPVWLAVAGCALVLAFVHRAVMRASLRGLQQQHADQSGNDRSPRNHR